MKSEIVKADALMNFLIGEIGVICKNLEQKCLCNYYFHELMQVLPYKNYSIPPPSQKKRKLNV